MRDRFKAQPIDTNWPRNVLDVLLAPILERVSELVADLIADHSGDANPAGLRERLQTSRDIHTVTEDVLLFNDYIAEIYADAEPDPSPLGQLGLALDHPALDLHRAADGIYDTRKFCQEAVSCVLYDPAPVLADIRIDQFSEMALEPLVRPFLVRTHQPRIPRHIGGKDRCKAAGGVHVVSPAASHRPDKNSSRCS